MLLMVVVGLVGLLGLGLTVRWGGASWTGWGGDRPQTVPVVAARYLRAAVVGAVGGAWAGLLVTGPAVRLVMRLLAATGPDSSRGRLTEADEVIGAVELDGTLGLLVFGGMLPGAASGLVYVALRHWLPAGRRGALVFGLLHLVVAATRVDPLRPDNPDFDLVGPGWLSALAFGLAAVVHGLAVRAFVDTCSGAAGGGRVALARRLAGTAPLLLAGPFLAPPVLAGLVPVLLWTRLPPLGRLGERRWVVPAGRLALVGLALVLLPWTVVDLVAVVDRS